MVKMNTGRWRWSESTPYPPWDAAQKCLRGVEGCQDCLVEACANN